MTSYDIVIAGGGIAGLTNAIILAKAGYSVLVIEKKSYPFHRVCGEYISNEALPFLKSIGADPTELGPTRINQLEVSSPKGTKISLLLKMGGFGISRYTLDYYLYLKAKEAGAEFLTNTRVEQTYFESEQFEIKTSDRRTIYTPLLIGCYGKRSNLDKDLERDFFYNRSPYIGVKYHIKYDQPSNKIALHNFKDGYCGISKTESERYCLCYLSSRENLKKFGNIPEMENSILKKNPYLNEIFSNAEFLFEKPEVINEISFEKKTAVENHILMSGDSAGMITPLCGNGMSMAFHSAKILTSLIILHYREGNVDRKNLELRYTKEWNKLFGTRLLIGRSIQKLFGNEFVTDATIRVLRNMKPVANWLVKKTHGKTF